MDLGSDNSSNSSEELCHSTLNSNSTFIRNVDFWGDGVFTFICGLTGVIGNFITIIIFRYIFENLVTNHFLKFHLKLYIPSALNIEFILWQTQLFVYAVKCQIMV